MPSIRTRRAHGRAFAPALTLTLTLSLLCGCTGEILGSGTELTSASAPPRSGAAAVAADRPLMRRLTHAQYDNTVRDLLGIFGDPASGFAEDEVQAGFDVNSTQPVQGLQLGQYQDAAERLATEVVSTHLAQVVGCSPTGAAEMSCIDSFVRSFGTRAYRRPPTDDEVARYVALFGMARMTGDFASGVELVLRAMLQSPYFLYRVELGAPVAEREADGALSLTGYELAARLSYFIWNTMPDDTLLNAARTDQLRTADQVGAMARRMLADPRARDAVTSFHEQWLGLGGLDSLEKVDPTFTPDLRAAMHQEVDDFSDFVVRVGDGRLQTLLSANFSFLRGPLFQLYGAAGSSAGAVQTQLPALQRAGIFTSAAVMATHAHADQTSLVHRGQMIREQLLCSPLPPPPPNVDTTPPPVDPNVSARVRFEQHTNSSACKACHGEMDPLGFTFESYDALGRYRTMDGTQPVDSSGALTGSASHDGNVVSAVDLLQRLAADDTARRCVAAQWFRFAFGRNEDDTDSAALAAAFDSFSRADYRIPDLIVALTTTRTFRYRRPVQ